MPIIASSYPPSPSCSYPHALDLPVSETFLQYLSWKTTLPLFVSSTKAALSSDRKGEYPHSNVYAITLLFSSFSHYMPSCETSTEIPLRGWPLGVIGKKRSGEGTYPILQQSTFNPCLNPSKTSGAAYPKLPANESTPPSRGSSSSFPGPSCFSPPPSFLPSPSRLGGFRGELLSEIVDEGEMVVSGTSYSRCFAIPKSAITIGE
jgi:hypothetical protein